MTEVVNKKSQDATLIFIDKERKLYGLLSRRDETGQLAKMLEGIIKTLSDLNNPMRFSQAANTIRGIADILLKLNNNTFNSSTPHVSEDEFEELKSKFEKILGCCITKIHDEENKNETSQTAERIYRQLKNVLSYGARTKKHQLLELLGSKDNLRILPKTLQDSAERLAKIYNYFTQVLHRHREVEPEFDENWLIFQDFLILVASGFFDLAKEIDPFLENGTIFDEELR